MTNLARFEILDGADVVSPSTDGGFDGTNGEAIKFRLENTDAVVVRTTFEVFDADKPDSPLASKDAPELTLTGATSGQIVDATSPSAQVTTTLPGSGAHSWKIRCLVNGGINPRTGLPDPDYVFERIVAIRSAQGIRKVIANERTEYSPRGWADAQNEDVDSGGGGSSLTAPANPADNGKIAIASSGDLTYVSDLTVPGLLGYGGQPVNGTREDKRQISHGSAPEVIRLDVVSLLGNNGQLSLALIGHIYSPTFSGYIWLARAHEIVIEAGSPGSVGAYRILDTDPAGGDRQANMSWTHETEYTVSLGVSGGNAVVAVDNHSGDDFFASITLAYTGTAWS